MMIGVSLASVLVSCAGDLILDASSGNVIYSDSVTYKSATKVIKTGSGKVTLSWSGASSFSGEIEVREGTLSADKLPLFGKPTKITVISGATLDLSSVDTDAGNIKDCPIYIAGEGVNGRGAIRRSNESVSGWIINGLLGKLYLTADARVSPIVQFGFAEGGEVHLDGHTLTVNGGNNAMDRSLSGTLYCNNVPVFADGPTDDHGHLVVNTGRLFLRGSSLGGGSAANTITVKGGACLKIRDLTSACKWSVVSDGTYYFETDDSTAPAAGRNVWTGPVSSSTQVSASPLNAVSRMTVSGAVTAPTLGKLDPGTSLLAGTNKISKLVVRAGTLGVVGGRTDIVEGDYGDGKALDQTAGRFVVSNAEFNVKWSAGMNLEGADLSTSPVTAFGGGARVRGDFQADGKPASRLYVGKSEDKTGVLEVGLGATVSGLALGIGRNGIGAYYQDGGTFSWPTSGAQFDAAGYESTAYGGFLIAGGTLQLNASNGASFGDQGICVLDVKGNGRFDVKNSNTAYFGLRGGTCMMRVADGGKVTLDHAMMLSNGDNTGNEGTAELTVSGEGAELSVADRLVDYWTGSGATALVNVNDGGTLSVLRINRKAGGNDRYYVNFNGGVLHRKTATDFQNYQYLFNAISNPDAAPDAVTVYENGVTFDIEEPSGTSYCEVPLKAPPTNGRRVSAIALPTDAAFASEIYLGSPRVKIVGAGQAAAAFAEYDRTTRKVTGITVVSPGWGYTSDTTATIESGNRKKTYSCEVTLADQPMTGRGLRKTGSKRIDFFGANTYLGPTEVTGGICGFKCVSAAQGGLPVGSGLILGNGATVAFPAADTAVTVPFLEGYGRVSSGCVTVTDRIRCRAADLFAGKPLTIVQSLRLGENAVVEITDAANLALFENERLAELVSVGQDMVVPANLKLEFSGGAADPGRWCLGVRGKSLLFGPRKGMFVIVR